MLSQSFFCKAPPGTGSKVGLHPGCVYAWKTVAVPGPYDERNKSYLELVDDNTKDFPDDCFFRVLASRGVVTLRPDEYTPVALNSFIDRCDPNVDIAYATSAHPLPFEPVTLKQLTDTRHPHARGLVPFVPGTHTKYFYPGSRIQLDNIVVGMTPADALAEIQRLAAAADAAATKAEDQDKLTALARDAFDVAKGNALDPSQSGDFETHRNEADAQLVLITGYLDAAMAELRNVTKFETAAGRLESSARESDGPATRAALAGLTAAIPRINAAISSIEGIKGAAETGLEEIERHGTTLGSAAGGGTPPPRSPTTGFAFTDDQKDQLDQASAKLAKIDTGAARSIAGTAMELKDVSVSPTDKLPDKRKSAYEALYDFFVAIGEYDGPELATSFADITAENLALIESANETELDEITEYYKEVVKGLSTYLSSIIAEQSSTIDTITGNPELTIDTPDGLSRGATAAGANDLTSANSEALYLKAWAAKIETVLREAGRNLFSAAGNWTDIIEHVVLVSRYVVALGAYREHVAEYRARLEETIEAVETDVKEVWRQTAGKCTAGTSAAAGLGATSTPATPVPEPASEAMERIMTGIGDGTTAAECNYSGTAGFEKVTHDNQAAINALVVRKQIEEHPYAMFAAPDDFKTTLEEFIQNRTGIELKQFEGADNARTSFNQNVVDKVKGWNKFIGKLKVANPDGTDYKLPDRPVVDFASSGGGGAAV